MRRVRYSVAMSLDGYIAGPGGEADWIPMDPEINFADLLAGFDVVLMGRRSFVAAQEMYGGGPMPGMRSVVASRTLNPADHPDHTVIGDGLPEFLAQLRREPGKDIWLFGGGSLFRSLLDARQVDAVEVAVVPVLLGGGKPFLPPGETRAKLTLKKQRVYQASGIVALEYAVA